VKQLIVESSTAQQTILDYINASNGVCNYAASINAAAIPDLMQPPPNYGDYATTFGQARLDVMAWLQEVVPSFGLIPTAFITFNDTVQAQLDAIESSLEQFQTDPQNAALEATIRTAVSKLLKEVEGCQGAVTSLDSTIAKYQQSIQPDAQSLTTLAKGMLAAEGADQAQIDKQNQVLATYHALIAARSELATLDTIGNWTFNVFIAVVGVAVGLPFAPVAAVVAGLIFGIGTATFTSFYAINSSPEYQQSLDEIQHDLDGVSQEIGWLNTAIGLLQAINAQFTALVAQSDTVRGQAATTLAFWEDQAADLTNMVNDLDDFLARLDAPGGIAQALADVEAARASWQDLTAFMQQISQITYSVTSGGNSTPVAQLPWSVQPATFSTRSS
jgi:prophage DNA circulation protein